MSLLSMNFSNFFCVAVLLVSVALTSGCGALSVPALGVSSEINKPNDTVAASVEENEYLRAKRVSIEKLLRAADSARANNQLSTPLNDNALDRYRAVLVLDKNNIQAQQGLAAIVSQYLRWARSNLASQQLTRASLNVVRALEVDPNNSDALLLRAEIRQQAPVVLKTLPQAARENEWPIDIARLDSHHPRLVDDLSVLARRLKLSGESMLIVARNDAEGRWIYKQMRQAVPGYRLRGNISIGRNPKVIIKPAL